MATRRGLSSLPILLIRARKNRERRTSAERRGAGADRAGGSVEGVERLADRHRDAGEDRRLALGVLARLGRPQLVDEVEELRRVVALEADDELLVVDPVGVGRVDRDLGVAAADLEVAFYYPAALLRRQPVPAPLLDHRVEEEVLAFAGADLRAGV